MDFSRRDALIVGAGATSLAMFPLSAFAGTLEEAMAAFTDDTAGTEGGVTLNAPEIAENGNTVPISVDAPGAVKIAILAGGNPNAEVVEFHFGPLSGSQAASTRIRLSGTQDVYAVAVMGDGSVKTAKAAVKVTIGGCGG